MSQAVHLEVFYPYPPERVWQVLTDRRALASWMMENDFEPRLGHRFRFYSYPLPGLKTTIQCEVVELEEPTRLVYTWKESPTAEPSLVIWTLNPVANGTQLRLKHHQYSYTPVVTTLHRPDAVVGTKRNLERTVRSHHPAEQFPSERFLSERFSGASKWNIPTYYSPLSSRTLSGTSDNATPLEIPALQAFTWDNCLNQTLPNVLAQDELC
jgi:uncharacterized protein YndB with AHSA1/START domain